MKALYNPIVLISGFMRLYRTGRYVFLIDWPYVRLPLIGLDPIHVSIVRSTGAGKYRIRLDPILQSYNVC